MFKRAAPSGPTPDEVRAQIAAELVHLCARMQGEAGLPALIDTLRRALDENTKVMAALAEATQTLNLQIQVLNGSRDRDERARRRADGLPPLPPAAPPRVAVLVDREAT